MVAAVQAHVTTGARPRPPLAGVPLWVAFAALSESRGWREAWPEAIRPADLEAWARVHGWAMPPHHAAIILAMDAAWLAWARVPEADRVVGVMTGAQFDAMFGG